MILRDNKLVMSVSSLPSFSWSFVILIGLGCVCLQKFY